MVDTKLIKYAKSACFDDEEKQRKHGQRLCDISKHKYCSILYAVFYQSCLGYLKYSLVRILLQYNASSVASYNTNSYLFVSLIDVAVFTI